MLMFQLTLVLAKSEIRGTIRVHAGLNALSISDLGTVEMAWSWAKVKIERSDFHARISSLLAPSFVTFMMWGRRR